MKQKNLIITKMPFDWELQIYEYGEKEETNNHRVKIRFQDEELLYKIVKSFLMM